MESRMNQASQQTKNSRSSLSSLAKLSSLASATPYHQHKQSVRCVLALDEFLWNSGKGTLGPRLCSISSTHCSSGTYGADFWHLVFAFKILGFVGLLPRFKHKGSIHCTLTNRCRPWKSVRFSQSQAPCGWMVSPQRCFCQRLDGCVLKPSKKRMEENLRTFVRYANPSSPFGWFSLWFSLLLVAAPTKFDAWNSWKFDNCLYLTFVKPSVFVQSKLLSAVLRTSNFCILPTPPGNIFCSSCRSPPSVGVSIDGCSCIDRCCSQTGISNFARQHSMPSITGQFWPGSPWRSRFRRSTSSRIWSKSICFAIFATRFQSHHWTGRLRSWCSCWCSCWCRLRSDLAKWCELFAPMIFEMGKRAWCLALPQGEGSTWCIQSQALYPDAANKQWQLRRTSWKIQLCIQNQLDVHSSIIRFET